MGTNLTPITLLAVLLALAVGTISATTTFLALVLYAAKEQNHPFKFTERIHAQTSSSWHPIRIEGASPQFALMGPGPETPALAE